MKIIRRFFKRIFSRSFLIYSLIGTVGTLNTAILSSLLALVIEDNTASYLGYVLSLSIGYLLNAKMNFHHRLSWVEYFRFMSAYIPSFILYVVLSTLANTFWDWWPFFSSVVAAIAGVPLTYALMYFYAFRNQKYKDAADKDI